MAKFSRLGRDMRRLAANVERNAPERTRRVALAIDTAVVTATPVDTGRARSNWQVSIGSPITTTIASYAQGASAGPYAIAQAQNAISGYRGGSVIHITNNLPYIGPLNDGHSAQAPIGFVQTAILVGVASGGGFAMLRDRQ